MKSDEQLKQDVQDELAWTASIPDSGIIVSASEGVVTLGGHVPAYADKIAAERAVKSIAGVRAVANDIDVKPQIAGQRADSEIAEAVLSALQSNVSVPADRITVVVRDGWITLEGGVPLWHQKSAAEATLHSLWGIKGITNAIKVEPEVSTGNVRGKIQSAFQRHAAIDAKNVKIEVLEGTVTLSGEVHSWHEKDDAETAAWSAPGVKHVKNNLSVITL